MGVLDRLGGSPDPNYRELVPVAPIGENRDLISSEQIMAQFPTNGTPLYDVTQKSYAAMVETYDPAKINAVVFLTDGVNDDGDLTDDDEQFETLISTLQSGSEGATSRPVRVFTISYGEGADTVTLRAIAAGDGGGALRRLQPGHDPAGVHQRDLQLLTSQMAPTPASATASSPRPWRGR